MPAGRVLVALIAAARCRQKFDSWIGDDTSQTTPGMSAELRRRPSQFSQQAGCPTADLMLIQAGQAFAGLEILLNRPPVIHL
jgi:hypothetical protein